MAVSDNPPNAVDLHVGARVRLRRKLLRMSQADLAGAIGLTFQQVQKYESGFNRISASKLYATAKALKVPVAWFFAGMNEVVAPRGDAGHDFVAAAGDVPHGWSDHTPRALADSLELIDLFTRIQVPSHRRRIVELVRALAGDDIT